MDTETAEAFDNLTAAIAQEREAHDALVEELKNENRKLAARIRELEGALRELLTVVHDEADDIDEDGGVCVYAFAADIEAARRILAKGGAS